MSTALRERPARAGAGNGGVPARRAVIRWSWRMFRREWRQQSLVLALIVVALAATVLGAAVATDTPPPSGAGFGTAQDHVFGRRTWVWSIASWVYLPITDSAYRDDLTIFEHTLVVAERLPKTEPVGGDNARRLKEKSQSLILPRILTKPSGSTRDVVV